MEATICFLEVRPYFFRSGYMFDALLRRAKHAPLSPEQSARLQVVVAGLRAWKASKRKKQKPNEASVEQLQECPPSTQSRHNRSAKFWGETPCFRDRSRLWVGYLWLRIAS
jgi:hypothetical protein